MFAPTITPSSNFLAGIPQEISERQPKPPDAYLIKLVECSDEDLCRNAQRGCLASRDLLWLRYREFVRTVLYKQNQRHHLPPQEIADALQELYFAFHATVRRYDPASHCHDKPASFKTFLRIVITHQFSNYCTQWRIYHKHMVLDFEGEVSESFIVETEPAWRFSHDHTGGNDHSSFNWQGFLLNELSSDRLASVLDKLKPEEKYLLEAWLQYGRDKEVAKVLGISPVAAKLRRERLFRRIRSIIEL